MELVRPLALDRPVSVADPPTSSRCWLLQLWAPTSYRVHALWTPSIATGRSVSSSDGMLGRAPVEDGPNLPLGSSTTAHGAEHPSTYE